MVAVIRDPGSGQSEARLTNLPEEDASPLFKGKNAKVGFIEGANGWEVMKLPLSKVRQLHPALKEVPDDTDADTVEACDKLGQNL